MTGLLWLGVGFLVLLVLVLVWMVGLYNGLVRTKNAVKNAWAQIEVQLKRRHDLIPNLVETVKGYMEHERETLEAVTQARQQAVNINSESIENVDQMAKAESMLSSTLRTLFAVSENYPDLKANTNFLALQEELTSTENKISYARQFYNDAVMKLNNMVEMFPSNVVAGMFNFNKAAFFEIEAPAEREAPKVAF